MKRKKQTAALALALCLSTPAYAVSTPFPDVPPESWYAGAVDYCLEHGLMRGVDGFFRPEASLTQAMLAEILYLPPGLPRRRARGPSRMPGKRSGMPAPPSGPLRPG